MTTGVTTDPEACNVAATAKRWRLFGLVVYWVAIFVASHLPTNLDIAGPRYFDLPDKLLHFLAYGILAYLLAWAWRPAKIGSYLLGAIGLWLIVAAYGGFDELTQLLVGRSCHLYDWLADLVGGAAGLWFYFRWHH